MSTTTQYDLTKPEYGELADIAVLNANTDKIATALFAIENPIYTEAPSLTELESNESIKTAFGKIKKAVKALIDHLNKSNPHAVTASQVGLGNANNTSDASKPISALTQAALDGKSDANHTHSYAGSSSIGGAATEAIQLQTARTIQANLGSNGTASFDGSANVSPGVTGTLPVTNGGTGQNSVAANSMLYSTAANTYSAVAANSTANRVLRTGTANKVPTWSQVDLGTDVSGTLPKANGGTGRADGKVTELATGRTIRTSLGSTSAATFDGSANIAPGVSGTLPVTNGGTGKSSVAANRMLYSTAANTYTEVAANNTANRVLRTGTANNAPTWSQVALGTDVSGKLPIANGGTGATTVSDARINLGIQSGPNAPSGGSNGDIYIQY